jgi:hypothetical protein
MANEECFKTKISSSGKKYFINTTIGISQWGQSLNPSRPYPIGWEYHESTKQKGIEMLRKVLRHVLNQI